MNLRRALSLLLLLASASAAPDKYMEVELGDGQKIMAQILEEECTDEFLVIRQIRPPKKMQIPWGDVQADQARDLRIELGFEAGDASPEALSMEGHRIKNKAGSVFTGLWTNPETAKSEGIYVLKTAEGERRVRAVDILSGPEAVTVSKLEVYTPRELYELRIKDKPPVTAEDHYRVAEFCFSIDAFEEAKLHYTRVLELDDPKYVPEKIERNLKRVQRLLDQSEAREGLKEIKRAIHYHRFDKARELIAAYREKYASEPDLIESLDYYAKELDQDRDKYYLGQVPRLLRDAVRDLLERKVKDEKELTLRDAQRYAGGDAASQDSAARHAVDKVAERLGLTAEEVLRYWNDRQKRNVYKGFYRDGTFIVIENLEDALAKAPKPKTTGGGKGDKGPTPPKPTPQRTPDQWWEGKVKARKYSDLRDWLYAYWAEKSGMCEVLDPKEELCPTCYGKGYTQSMHATPQGSVPFINRCQTCHMAKSFRVVQFR